MTEVLFYHLTQSRLEEALPDLLEKSLGRGWRVVVQFSSEERRDALAEIVALGAVGETFGFELKLRLEFVLQTAIHQLFGLAIDVGRTVGEARRELIAFGVEIGGAVKNVLAIGCGIVEGRGLGDNTKAALMTRGLAEIVRLGLAKGAKAETLMGLSGIGDLVLTCNAMQSRNFSLGVALGQGEDLNGILAARTSVAEGVFSAASVSELAGSLSIDMPLSVAVDGILNHFADIDATIEGLLARPAGAEQ